MGYSYIENNKTTFSFNNEQCESVTYENSRELYNEIHIVRIKFKYFLVTIPQHRKTLSFVANEINEQFYSIDLDSRRLSMSSDETYLYEAIQRLINEHSAEIIIKLHKLINDDYEEQLRQFEMTKNNKLAFESEYQKELLLI